MDAPQPAFLGVERSLSGRRWYARDCDERLSLAIAQQRNLPEILARVLAGRGADLAAIDDYLEPTLRRALPDPSHLLDMDRAAERLARAVRENEEIAIFGDYDVDGATSSALLLRFLRAVGGRVRAYIPDRQKEGYGPNAPALQALRQAGVSLAVTVDCGISAFEALQAARDCGLDTIVVDHHVAEPRLPQAVAVINPNRLDETSPHRNLAAVGVAFLLVVATNRALRQAGWFVGARTEPDLMQWLDLVALGTICDMVPLTGLNRALVVQGLKVMGQRGNRGLAALADVARVAEPPGTFHAGFLFGPRVNAGGRIGAADLGTRLLSTEDAAEAAMLAERLDVLNAERRAIEASVLDQALRQVEALAEARGDLPPFLLLAGEDWHPGVIGIVASRVLERTHRPVFVVGLSGDTGKGSGRSIRGVDLGSAVIAARQAGLLINGGGHPMAAGLTVARDRLDALRDFLTERVSAALGGVLPAPGLGIDGPLMPAAATLELAGQIERIGPFGIGNAEPRFVLPGVRIEYAGRIGDGGHVRCVLGAGGARLNAIAFRVADNPVGQALLQRNGLPVHVAGALRVNRWRGKAEVQLQIDDAAPAGLGA
ncbi:MAG: single-stranded-DNA-specific exonuclease RecJ [Reyranellaceae bacterium]